MSKMASIAKSTIDKSWVSFWGSKGHGGHGGNENCLDHHAEAVLWTTAG